MFSSEEDKAKMPQLEEEINNVKDEIKVYKAKSPVDEVAHMNYLSALTNRLVGLEARRERLEVKVSALAPQQEVDCIKKLIQRGGFGDINIVFNEELGFKIPIIYTNYIANFPDVFEYGVWSHRASVELWLEHNLVGSGEHSVISLDSAWEGILQGFLPGLIFYRDQHDPSSVLKCRPDLTVVYNNCLVLKVEAKENEQDMEKAEISLIDKFQGKAYEMFPVSSSIIGVCSSATLIKIFKISYNHNSESYETALFTNATYRVALLHERVRFLVDMMKLLRWIYTVNQPIRKFHLIPNIRIRTINHHYVTWDGISIIKEFKGQDKDIIDLKYIKTIYQMRLLNVEYGEVIDGVFPPTIKINRIGKPLSHAIHNGYAKDVAYQQIEAGLHQLHGLGLGHGDIKVNNIFVDDNDIVFLGDLEYCAPLGSNIPIKRRPETVTNNMKIEEFDALKLSQLKLDILKL